MNKNSNKSLLVVLSLVIVAAITRLLPHPPNFAPIIGMTLLGAAYFSRKWMIYVIPVLAFWVSDLVLNNTVYAPQEVGFTFFNAGMIFIYGSVLLIALLGTGLLKKVSSKTVILSSLASSVIFYLISNFGVWVTSAFYPKTLAGLGACMSAGMPFLQNGGSDFFFLSTLVGDLFYSGILFGLYYLFVTRNQAILSTEKA